MWPREEQMFIVFNRLNGAASAEQSDALCLKRSTQRRRSSSPEIDGRHFLSRHRSAALQAHRLEVATGTNPEHWRSTGEDQTAGGNTRADEILKYNSRAHLRVAVAARKARQLGLINIQLKLSEWESCLQGADSWSPYTLCGPSKSPIFSLLELHKVTKTRLTKLPCKLMHQRLI